MRRGARSIRGSLGAYLTASLVALAALGLVLWLGWPRLFGDSTFNIELAADSDFSKAALDDGHHQYTLDPGQPLSIPPGDYRLTLLTPDGRTESRPITVTDELLLVR